MQFTTYWYAIGVLQRYCKYRYKTREQCDSLWSKMIRRYRYGGTRSPVDAYYGGFVHRYVGYYEATTVRRLGWYYGSFEYHNVNVLEGATWWQSNQDPCLVCGRPMLRECEIVVCNDWVELQRGSVVPDQLDRRYCSDAMCQQYQTRISLWDRHRGPEVARARKHKVQLNLCKGSPLAVGYLDFLARLKAKEARNRIKQRIGK